MTVCEADHAAEQHAQAREALSRAKTKLVRELPELASELLRVPLVVTQVWGIDTAATDGRMIAFDAAFAVRLAAADAEAGSRGDTLKAVLLHELLHIVCCHAERRQDRDALMWNCAVDYVVNNMAIDLGANLPTGALIDRSLSGRSGEQIYRLLMADPAIRAAVAEQRASYGLADTMLTPEEGDALAAGAGLQPLTRTAVLEIARRGRTALEVFLRKLGHTSPNAELGALDAIHRPPPRWRQALSDWCQQPCRDESSFTRPNRRMLGHVGHGFVLPGQSGRTAHGIVVGLDTSGSRWDHRVLACVLGQIEQLRDAMGCPCWIVSFDTKVTARRQLEPGESLVATDVLRGGGGTDFRCFFDELEEIRTSHAQAVAVIITDCMGMFPTVPHDQTCWLVPAAFSAAVPFGVVVRYDEQLDPAPPAAAHSLNQRPFPWPAPRNPS